MSSEWSEWLLALPPFKGLLAAGVRSPDQTTHSKGWVEGFPEGALANEWRCVDDTFRVMRLHRFPAHQLRWIYDQAVLTAVRREDGRLLLVLTEPDLPQEGRDGLDAWINAFLSGSKHSDAHLKTTTRGGTEMFTNKQNQ